MHSSDSRHTKNRAHLDEILLEISNYFNSSNSGYSAAFIAEHFKIDRRTAARCLRLLVKIGKNRPLEETKETVSTGIDEQIFWHEHHRRSRAFVPKYVAKQEPTEQKRIRWTTEDDITQLSEGLLKKIVELVTNTEKIAGREQVLELLARNTELPALVVLNSSSLSTDAWLLMACIRYHVPFVVCNKEYRVRNETLRVPFDEKVNDCFAFRIFTEEQAELYRKVISTMLDEDVLPSPISLEINAHEPSGGDSRVPYYKFDVFTAVSKARRTGEIVRGLYPTLKAIERAYARLVVISVDVYPSEIKNTIVRLCKMKNVPYVLVSSSADLGEVTVRRRNWSDENKLEGQPIGACAIIRLGNASRMVSKAMDEIRSLDTTYSGE